MTFAAQHTIRLTQQVVRTRRQFERVRQQYRLDGTCRAIEGGTDGTVWAVVVAPDARVREDGTWRSEPITSIE